uniref:Uncharacterized protein n=1 Tax=Plectus sambesii TaxID=2011161 RepID=A0A914WV12_9BILA
MRIRLNRRGLDNAHSSAVTDDRHSPGGHPLRATENSVGYFVGAAASRLAPGADEVRASGSDGSSRLTWHVRKQSLFAFGNRTARGAALRQSPPSDPSIMAVSSTARCQLASGPSALLIRATGGGSSAPAPGMRRDMKAPRLPLPIDQ